MSNIIPSQNIDKKILMIKISILTRSIYKVIQAFNDYSYDNNELIDLLDYIEITKKISFHNNDLIEIKELIEEQIALNNQYVLK